LSDGLLLLAGECAVQVSSRWSATIKGQDVSSRADALSYSGPHDAGLSGRRSVLILIRCESIQCIAAGAQRLVLETDAGAVAFNLASLPAALTDVRTLLRESVAGLDADTRSRVMEFLVAGAADGLTGSTAAAPSMALFTAREALRERLPAPRSHHAHLLGGSIDSFHVVAANSFYVRGWIASTNSPLVRVTAVSPEGCRTELLDRLHRYPRPDLNALYGRASRDGDVQEFGFICHFETQFPNYLDDGWLIEATNAAGDEIELQIPAVERQLLTVRDSLLGDINFGTEAQRRLVSDHIAPALLRIQQRHAERIRVRKVIQYGTPPINPAVSVIVPLYGRLDFLEQQMAQFVQDPELREADLIYVLDSPELASALEFLAPRLEWLYHVPFRIVLLKSNVGFSGANNAGISLARSPLLLLLNPDVLPDKPGWLGKMAAFYRSKPAIGALGPKLLYEDEALQHAGMYFYQDEGTGHWRNEHYFKGLHRSLPPANITRSVPAVTGACLMIGSDLYHELGGLSGHYIQGDYEDSELCLRLLESGRENWYLADVDLYHLEGQSYPAELRKLTGHYNRWLQSHRWGHVIEKCMAKTADVAAIESTNEFPQPAAPKSRSAT
jgi:GT2 family glycosyltransferase